MDADSPLVAKVRQSWSRLGEAGGLTVVAVSGGPDSVALLHALREVGAGPLLVAHLNHQLRGADSDADEEFVRRLHASLAGAVDPEFCCERIDVAARSRAAGENLEKAARDIRYDWLVRLASERQAGRVATGHTADDQAETVLHRVLRGTGLKGLCGIPARRSLVPGVEVVRPLLAVTRAEVLDYLAAGGLTYREDPSNRDVSLTRNRIRHDLMPRLARDYNPAVVSVLGRLAGQAEELYREVESRARQLLAEAELPRAGGLLVFDRPRLAAAPRSLVREVFRLAWEREGWPAGAMTFDDWDRVAATALGESPAVELPGRLRVSSRGRVVQAGPVS